MPVALSYRRYLGWGVTLAAVAFGVLWVFLLADRPAHSDPTTLSTPRRTRAASTSSSRRHATFGLMRVVNMAHGSLYLIAAYVAIVSRRIITQPRHDGRLDAVSVPTGSSC
jgi:branched-chain amino acid transport system permease protein